MGKQYDVCMLGMGPVGTISAACFAKQGFQVVGVDIDEKRVKSFAEGKAPFEEPGVHTLIKEVQEAGRFRVTSNGKEAIRNARIVMIAVGTPTPPESGQPDLSQLDAVSRTIGEALKGEENGETIIVLRSTVPPGTLRGRMAGMIEEASGLEAGKGFHMASNPEFLREGKAIQDFFHTGRVVIGAEAPQVADAIAELYREVEGEQIRVSIESAEFAKYVDNTWHALKVSFANEIGRVCQAFGGNVEETTRVFLADHNLNISEYYLRPGFAFGGSCLPKDTRGLSHLAKTLGVNLPIVGAILPSNQEQIEQGVQKLLATGTKTIGMLGIAFKEDVDDLRESPALAVAARLKEEGCTVLAHDPAFQPGTVIALPGSKETLTMTALDEMTEASEAMALMHNLPVYRRIQETYTDGSKAVIDLTTVTQLTASERAAARKAASLTLVANTNETEEEDAGLPQAAAAE